MKFWGWVGTALLMAVLAACTRPPQAAHPIMESEAPFGKLPPRARPLAYDVALKVDPREESFRGIVKIDVWLNEPSDGIWLHGKDLRVNAASINGRTATWEEVLNSTGVSRIVFPRTFPAGEVTLAIAYEADFNKNLAGLFRVEEEGEAYALAKSESIQARRFLPSFDEPGLKAPFDIALVVPQGYQAISNTPEISRRPARDDEGFEEVRFDTTRPLSTYLLSVAVGPFDVVEAEDIPPNDIRSEPIPLRGFAGKGRGDQLARALETTGPLVEIFETALDQPYPYQKLDIIAAPAWPSGATELAGAITYREERLLLDENSGPAADRAMLNIHTHELAHMWFGNLVTPPWWDDLWLKEAYATWGTPLALIEYEPDAGHEVDAVMRAISAMRLDSLSSTRAVREPIGRNENIRNAYDAITYSKGMAVIAMADAYFGAGVFRPALGRYIAEFADKDAGSPDFYKVIGDVTGEPSMTAVFESFVEQKGVPLLSTNVTCEEAETIEPAVTLSQARYRPLGSAIELGTQWTVPVCVAFDNGTDRPGRACGMMRDETLTVSLGSQAACPAWVWPNADGAGYFRIALSEADWAAIVDHFDQLSATEALSAVDSAVAAFEAGEGNARDILSVLEAASRHSDRRVAIAPTQPIRRLSSLLAEGEARTALRDEVTRWYLPRFDGLAGDDGADATVLRRDLEAFLAIDLEEAGVREALLANASSFLGLEGDRDPAALSSDRYTSALIVGVQDGGAAFFDALLESRATISDPRFDAARAVALGAARTPDLAERVRGLAIAGTLGPRESLSLVAGQMQGEATRAETWDWLRANYPDFVKVLPGQWPRQTPALARGFCDGPRVSELEALFSQHGQLAPGHERSLAQTREAITLCAALKSARAEEIGAALNGEAG